MKLQSDSFYAPSDEELVRQLAVDDPGAREAIYRKHFESVWSTALRLLGHRADAEDVVQDAFLTAFRDMHALRDASALKAWLLQITVHQAHRRFRHRRLLRSLGLDWDGAAAKPDHFAHKGPDLEIRAELCRLDGVLRHMPAAQRVAWLWRRVQGCSLEETASACGCSLATAKRRIRATDERIREHVECGNPDDA